MSKSRPTTRRRHLVCLSFDFDCVSLPISKKQTTPTPISRGEFGVIGADRILRLLASEGIRGTWFIPGHTLESFPKLCQRIHNEGHEIGHHGWTHRAPRSLGLEQEEYELIRANDEIKKLTGKSARGYRSPAWDLSPNTVGLLAKHNFVYESSMMGSDYIPYFVRIGDTTELLEPMTFGCDSPILEIPISWSLDDFPHWEFTWDKSGVLQGLSPASGVVANWIDDFDYMMEEGLEWGVITYTFHPFVSGRGHRMMALKRLIQHLKSNGAVFVTMEEAAVEAKTRLNTPGKPASGQHLVDAGVHFMHVAKAKL